MKMFFYLCAALSLAFSNVTLAAEAERFTAKAFATEEMESYVIHSDNVSSVDILVDYDMTKVSCHGPDYEYSSVADNSNGTLFVSKNAQVHLAVMCPPFSSKMVQGGLKVTVPASQFHSVYQIVKVPAGSKVEFTKTEIVK